MHTCSLILVAQESGLVDRALRELAEEWRATVEEVYRERRIESQRDRVEEILQRGKAAYNDRSEIDALVRAVADANECELTDELRLYLPLWEKAATARQQMKDTQEILEQGHAAVRSGRQDNVTAAILEEYVAKAEALPKNEIVSEAIATWKKAIAAMRVTKLNDDILPGNRRLQVRFLLHQCTVSMHHDRHVVVFVLLVVVMLVVVVDDSNDDGDDGGGDSSSHCRRLCCCNH